VFADDTLYVSVGGSEYKTYCIALDTKSQEVLWETCIEGYVIEQTSLYLNHLYLIVSPFTSYLDFNYGFIDHDQQVIEINRATGEIQAKSPKSPFSGVARIVSTYRHNLITQGPAQAYLEFCPID
jgi:hypothetical protein